MKLINIVLGLLFSVFIFHINAQETERYPANYASAPRFKALIYYTTNAEEAHVQFARQTVDFFKRLSWGDGYILEVTTDFSF